MSQTLSIQELEALLTAAKQEQAEQARQAFEGQLNKLLDEKTEKKSPAKQPKVIRDSFTLPENDYELIAKMQERALDMRLSTTKGEVLRAGLHALERMSNEELLAILQTVEKLRPGRRKDS